MPGFCKAVCSGNATKPAANDDNFQRKRGSSPLVQLWWLEFFTSLHLKAEGISLVTHSFSIFGSNCGSLCRAVYWFLRNHFIHGTLRSSDGWWREGCGVPGKTAMGPTNTTRNICGANHEDPGCPKADSRLDGSQPWVNIYTYAITAGRCHALYC